MKVLATGGTGYIGSHTVVELLDAGHEVVILDNLCNSSREVLVRIEELTGRAPDFYEADLRDPEALARIFREHAIEAVIHFAGLKAVGESVEMPLDYYDNNVRGTLELCRAMADHEVKNLVFSSSCTVYGDPETVPITEELPVGRATNPYGRSKTFIEEILRDVHVSDPAWKVVLLRYFNPVGAHESGRIGEHPDGIPNNLVPSIAQVAVGKRPELRVFGDDYPTADGTCIRDYIHVVDLARGHVRTLETLAGSPGVAVYNLGTGRGYSVLEVLAAFQRACGREIAHRVVERRPGDVACVWADPTKARRELAWEATRDIDQMCADAWRWQSANPNGYD